MSGHFLDGRLGGNGFLCRFFPTEGLGEELPKLLEELLDLLPNPGKPPLFDRCCRLLRLRCHRARDGGGRLRIQAGFQSLGMPLQVITDDTQDPVQIAFRCHQQAQIQLAVFNEINAAATDKSGNFQIVGVGLLGLSGSNRHQIRLILCKQGAEHFVEQLGQGLGDLGIGIFRQVDTQNLLVIVAALRDAVDSHFPAVGKVIAPIHMIICRGTDGEIRILLGQPQRSNLALIAHSLGILGSSDHIISHLAIGGSAGDMVGSTAHQHSAIRGDGKHFVILAAEGEELAGQISLEDLAPQFCAQIMAFALFVFGDVACVLQIAEQGLGEAGVADEVDGLHGADLHRKLPLGADGVDAKGLLLTGSDPAEYHIAQFIPFHQANRLVHGTDLLPQGLLDIFGGQIQEHQFVLQHIFRHLACTQTQAQPHHHIAPGAGIVCHDVGNGLGVCIKDRAVFCHVILQQILRRNDVDKALIFCPGGEVTFHLKHITGFIFHGDIAVFAHLCVPEVGGNLKMVVQTLLGHRQLSILQQIVVVLPYDPVHIHHREALAAVPLSLGYLILQSHKGQLRAGAQVSGQVGQHSVLEVLFVRLPAHIGADAAMAISGSHFRDAAHEDVGQGVQQAVAVFVCRAEGRLIFAGTAAADNGVQADLGSGHQPGRLDEHYEFYLREEFSIGFMEFQIMDAGTGDDTHVQILRLAAKNTDVPHLGHIGNGLQTFLTPGSHIALSAMAAQNDKHLLMPQQSTVHGIAHIGDQVVIERIVKQDALAAEQISAGEQIVPIQLSAGFQLPAHVDAIGLQFAIVAGLQLGQNSVIGAGIRCRIHNSSILCSQLIAEELTQHPAQHHIVGDLICLICFSMDRALGFPAGQAAEEEADFTHEDQSKHREKAAGQQAVGIQIPAQKQQPHAEGSSRIVHGLHQGPALEQVFLHIPLGIAGILLIEKTCQEGFDLSIAAAEQLA